MEGTIAAVASGSVNVTEVIAEWRHLAHVRYLYAVKVLEADERIGKVRARRLMDIVGGEETTRIGALTDGQISDILERLARVDPWA